MALAEIIVHPRAAPAAADAVCDLARRCGRNPVVIRDQPEAWGFVASRINRAVRQEARRAVDEGVATRDQVDCIMKDCFRWPIGPFEMQRPPAAFGMGYTSTRRPGLFCRAAGKPFITLRETGVPAPLLQRGAATGPT